jgi:hypothetical protein
MEEKAKENLYLIVWRKKLVIDTIKKTTIYFNNHLNSARRNSISNEIKNFKIKWILIFKNIELKKILL